MKNDSPLTPEEWRCYEWCASMLEEEHLLECQNEAEEIACKEAFDPKAYEELLRLLVRVRVHELSRLQP